MNSLALTERKKRHPHMTPPQLISFVNGFSRVSDADVATYVKAQGVQFARDVAPIWGICPGVEFTPGATAAPDGACPAWLSDTLDVDGALGYHDEDAHGNPYIKIADISGYDWRTTASHECLELKGDSPANIWAQMSPTEMVAYELADPVEGDTYEIDGVPMSNFVLPAWFDPQAAHGSRLDFLGKLTKPLTMTAGGYMIVWTLRGQPTQVFGAHVHEVSPGLHIHFGVGVSVERRAGIIAKYRKTGRRARHHAFNMGQTP
jgi:hypothetical protein